MKSVCFYVYVAATDFYNYVEVPFELRMMYHLSLLLIN